MLIILKLISKSKSHFLSPFLFLLVPVQNWILLSLKCLSQKCPDQLIQVNWKWFCWLLRSVCLFETWYDLMLNERPNFIVSNEWIFRSSFDAHKRWRCKNKWKRIPLDSHKLTQRLNFRNCGCQQAATPAKTLHHIFDSLTISQVERKISAWRLNETKNPLNQHFLYHRAKHVLGKYIAIKYEAFDFNRIEAHWSVWRMLCCNHEIQQRPDRKSSPIVVVAIESAVFFLSYSQHDRKINNDFVISQDIVAVAVEHFVIFLNVAVFHSQRTLHILQSFSCWIIHFYMDFDQFRCAMDMALSLSKWMRAYLCVRVSVCFCSNLIAHRFHFPSWISFFTILFLIGRTANNRDRLKGCPRVYCIRNVCVHGTANFRLAVNGNQTQKRIESYVKVYIAWHVHCAYIQHRHSSSDGDQKQWIFGCTNIHTVCVVYIYICT